MSIKTAIDSISNHIEDIYDTLELGGEDLTNKDKNINNIYTNIKNRYKDYLANGTDMIWNNWTNKNIQEGEALNFNNTIEAKIKTELKGNTTQADTPTPSTPQDIHIVTGDNTVKVLGKSLVPIVQNDTTTSSYVKITNGIINVSFQNDVIGEKKFATGIDNELRGANFGNYVGWRGQILKAGTYTLNYKYISGTTSTGTVGSNFLRINVYGRTIGTTGNVSNALTALYIATQNNSSTFTISEDMEINVVIYMYSYGTQNININFETMLVAGSNADYNIEPYIETTQLLSLGSIELAKIGDYTDRIFKAVQGNSIYDSLDSTTKASLTVGSWYKQGNIGKYNDWDNLYNATSKTVTNVLNYRLPVVTTYGLRSQAMCNCFENIISNNDEEHFFIGTGEANVFHGLNIFINKSRASDSDLAIAWLKNNNTVVYYIQATPTYTEITDTTLIGQLNNLEKLKSYNKQTNIFQSNNTDLPFIINATVLQQLT